MTSPIRLLDFSDLGSLPTRADDAILARHRYRIGGHSALVVQAGTMSTRGHGEPTSFTVVRLARPEITVERFAWDKGRQTFLSS